MMEHKSAANILLGHGRSTPERPEGYCSFTAVRENLELISTAKRQILSLRTPSLVGKSYGTGMAKPSQQYGIFHTFTLVRLIESRDNSNHGKGTVMDKKPSNLVV